MADQSGSVYGLTILSPILQDEKVETSHSCAIRIQLACWPRDEFSPFARLSSTHMARLVVMDDVVYVGAPSCEEHLARQYLIFETNFDGDLDTYLARMAKEIPSEADAIWQHCWGYPGAGDAEAFRRYMKNCRVPTTFYFADVNDKTVKQTLVALQTQASVAEFVLENQGLSASELQRSFAQFMEKLRNSPPPVPGRPGTGGPPRIETAMQWAARRTQSGGRGGPK